MMYKDRFALEIEKTTGEIAYLKVTQLKLCRTVLVVESKFRGIPSFIYKGLLQTKVDSCLVSKDLLLDLF